MSSPPPFVLMQFHTAAWLPFRLTFLLPLARILSEGCGGDTAPTTLANSQILQFLSFMALSRSEGSCSCVGGAVSSPPPFVPMQFHTAVWLPFRLTFLLPLARILSEGCGGDTAPTTLANSQILQFLSFMALSRSEGSCSCVGGAVSSPPPFVPMQFHTAVWLPFRLTFLLPLARILSEGCGGDTAPTTLANSQILQFLSFMALSRSEGSCSCVGGAVSSPPPFVPMQFHTAVWLPFRLTFLLPLARILSEGCGGDTAPTTLANSLILQFLTFMALSRSEGPAACVGGAAPSPPPFVLMQFHTAAWLPFSPDLFAPLLRAIFARGAVGTPHLLHLPILEFSNS